MIDSILPGFAALDLGATKIFAAAAATPVKTFGTFTGELRALSAWLTEHQVHCVAMEATGVYWIPVHDLLQAAGFQVTLFHGRGGGGDKRGTGMGEPRTRAICRAARAT